MHGCVFARCVYLWVCLRMRMRICICIPGHMYVYARILYAFVYTYMCTCVVCTCVCVYMCAASNGCSCSHTLHVHNHITTYMPVYVYNSLPTPDPIRTDTSCILRQGHLLSYTVPPLILPLLSSVLHPWTVKYVDHYRRSMLTRSP